jgi:hypothetical protein
VPGCTLFEEPGASRSARRSAQLPVCMFLNRTTVDAPESNATVSSFGPTSGAFAVRRRRLEVGSPSTLPWLDKRYAFPLEIFNHGAFRRLFQVNLAVSVVQEEIEAAQKILP